MLTRKLGLIRASVSLRRVFRVIRLIRVGKRTIVSEKARASSSDIYLTRNSVVENRWAQERIRQMI